jgi:hypothetical protein
MSTDPIDRITVDIPLFIRLLEYAREDAKSDMDLHDLTERIIKKSQHHDILTMDDYYELVSDNKNKQMEDIIRLSGVRYK